MNLLNKEAFFNKYPSIRGKEKEFDELGYTWSDMEAIYDDYIGKISELEVAANALTKIILEMKKVHSVRKRVKDPEHLIEKIIRRSLEFRGQYADISNYCYIIKDMVGIRILHLYKEDWLDIHNNIKANWEQDETPIANIKKGDKEDVFIKNGCTVKVHELGYRSVHYSIRCNTNKAVNTIAEIQVRTLFEEAWSEMDHEVRYPYYQNDPILGSFLQTFSGIVGNADSMGSFVIFLKNQLYKKTDSEDYVSLNNPASDNSISDLVKAEEYHPVDDSAEDDDEEKLRNIYNSLNYGGHNNFYIQNFAVTEFRNFPVEKLSAASSELQLNIGKSLIEIAPSNNNSGSYQARDFLEGLKNTDNKYPMNFVKGIFVTTLKRYHYLWVCNEYFNTALDLTLRLSEEESLVILDEAIKELSEKSIEIFHGGKKCNEVIGVIENHLSATRSDLLKAKLMQLANILRSVKSMSPFHTL